MGNFNLGDIVYPFYHKDFADLYYAYDRNCDQIPYFYGVIVEIGCSGYSVLWINKNTDKTMDCLRTAWIAEEELTKNPFAFMYAYFEWMDRGREDED
jgi:hypothetical protein